MEKQTEHRKAEETSSTITAEQKDIPAQSPRQDDADSIQKKINSLKKKTRFNNEVMGKYPSAPADDFSSTF